MSKNESKIKLLMLYEILRRKTDENNPLSTTQLIEELKNKGVNVSRKILAEDIALLNEFGYEVLSIRSKSNLYFVVDRKFEITELKILIDAVESASFITKSKTEVLIDKIANLAGENRAELLKKNIIYFDNVKHTNEGIYYNIDTLDTAIIDKKKVSFLYFDLDIYSKRVYRKDKTRYIVNPLALIYTNDNYYLVCYNDKYENLSNYRVDRMENVKAEYENITDLKKFKTFDISQYKKQAFAMFTGEIESVELKVSKNLIDVIIDKFGDNVKYSYIDKEFISATTNIQISPMFFGWLSAFEGKIKILAPQKIIMSFNNFLQKNL